MPVHNAFLQLFTELSIILSITPASLWGPFSRSIHVLATAVNVGVKPFFELASKTFGEFWTYANFSWLWFLHVTVNDNYSRPIRLPAPAMLAFHLYNISWFARIVYIDGFSICFKYQINHGVRHPIPSMCDYSKRTIYVNFNGLMSDTNRVLLPVVLETDEKFKLNIYDLQVTLN
jgi:hypothetical protein